MKRVTYVTLLLLLVSSTDALAHPVDDQQEPLHHLGLDDPEFFACHKHYWHCRRELNAQIREYSECIGEAKAINSILGWPEPLALVAFRDYWDVIPAHPIEDRPGDVAYCEAHIQACELTFQPLWLNACRAYVSFTKWAVFGVSQ